jgi:hypothetical protein
MKCKDLVRANDRPWDYFNVGDVVYVIIDGVLTMRRVVGGYRHHEGMVNFDPVGGAGLQSATVVKLETFDHISECLRCRENFYSFSSHFEGSLYEQLKKHIGFMVETQENVRVGRSEGDNINSLVNFLKTISPIIESHCKGD